MVMGRHRDIYSEHFMMCGLAEWSKSPTMAESGNIRIQLKRSK